MPIPSVQTIQLSRSLYRPPQQQFGYTRKSDNSFPVDWRVLKNGSYVVGDTLTCTRMGRVRAVL
ncbi:MAG: hypothetical protein WBE30_14325 [Candidatus Cybelea sp.]